VIFTRHHPPRRRINSATAPRGGMAAPRHQAPVGALLPRSPAISKHTKSARLSPPCAPRPAGALPAGVSDTLSGHAIRRGGRPSTHSTLCRPLAPRCVLLNYAGYPSPTALLRILPLVDEGQPHVLVCGIGEVLVPRSPSKDTISHNNTESEG
jgi:hypothetical protein